MKISKRSLFTVIALVLTLSVTAFGTVAYMTDRDQVVNTFTVGNINIVVDEKNVDGIPDENGVITPARDQANEYKLIPGMVYDKDPAMTVKAGSEECYVRFRVELSCVNALREIYGKYHPNMQLISSVDVLNWLVNVDKTNWELKKDGWQDKTMETAVFEFWYKKTGDADFTKVNAAGGDVTLPALFTTFTVPLQLTAEDLSSLSGLELKVYGDAVQTATFNNATDAWKAYDNQFTPVTPDNSQEDAGVQTPDDTQTEGEGSQPGEDQTATVTE